MRKAWLFAMNIDNVLISVIITTCKRDAGILLRAVKSIQQQTYKNWELIIIDDSPSSYSERSNVENAVCALMEDRITYIQHEKNMGAQVSRNQGLALAKGEWISFLDDDDEYVSDKLETQLKAAKRYGVLWVAGKSIFFDDKRSKGKLSKEKCYNGYVFEHLLYNNFIPSITPLVNKQCYEKVGNFDETLESGQDYDMWLRIAREYEIYCLKTPGVIRHLHSAGRITNDPHKKIQGLTRIINKYYEDLKKNPKCYCKKVMHTTKYYIMLGEIDKAQKGAKKANKIYPGFCIRNGLYYVYWTLKYR